MYSEAVELVQCFRYFVGLHRTRRLLQSRWVSMDTHILLFEEL